MKTILILLDSLNLNYLKAYNPKTNTITPNIDKFSLDSIKFTENYIGSAPCMPARRDIFTGRLNFLERIWGGIEPFDITFPHLLRKKGIQNHMITDHTHYVEIGGENYLQQFQSWECIRGQEFDQWASSCHAPQMPSEYYGKISVQYELNKRKFKQESDFPTPKTFETACDWVKDNKEADEFFLMVEAFDPHEPFDTPKEYLELYEDSYDGPHYNWSGYEEITHPHDATKHLQNSYKATLTMTDKWFGKFIDSLKENNLYEDTMIILTTDHGHLLGEHNLTGKNFCHAYNELAHIPLFVRMPNSKYAGEEINALTQNIDIMPTLLELYNIDTPKTVRGKSLLDLIEKKTDKLRDSCIFGWHGQCLNITDGRYSYFQSPNPDTTAYNYCCIPSSLWSYIVPEDLEEIEMGRFLKHTRYPVYKFKGNSKPNKFISTSLLFDNKNDPDQMSPIDDEYVIEKLKAQMKLNLAEHDAPDELYERFYLNSVEAR